MSLTPDSKRILGVNDLRGTSLVTGTPESMFGKGLVVGFADAGSLGVPELDPAALGNLTVNAMASTLEQLDCMFREFTHPSARFLQHPVSATEWGEWETHEWDHTGFARLHREQEFTQPQIFGKAVVETAIDLGDSTVIDASLGGVFTKTISRTTEFSVINTHIFQNTGCGVVSFALKLTNGGLEEITWWPELRWPGGHKPSLTPAGTDLLGFMTIDGGLNWLGVILGQNYK